MVDTIKFSEMTNAGNINNDDIVPSLRSGENVILNNPWTFLPPGTTAQRPTPSATINYRLRFNTDDQLYEYYDAILGMWTQLQESAFTQGPFLTYTADASLPDAQNLGALANGILKQTITMGSATLDIAVNEVDYYGPGMTGYIQSPAGIKDVNGNIIVAFEIGDSGADEYIVLSNGIIGDPASVSVDGAAADIQLNLFSKGLGQIAFNTTASSAAYSFFTGTSYQHETVHNFANTANAVQVTWQDSDGTIAYLSDIPGGTPSALTKVNDTNVTLTLGGTPATALLQPVSLTLGWTGLLSPIRGGTGVNNGTSTLTLAGALSTIGAFTSAFTMTGATAVTFPISGTLATTSQLVTPAALTKVDDTNVTLSLGGSPSTALVNAASLTLGWTGTLAGTRGGTGVNNGANTATFAGNLNFANSFTTAGNFAVTQTYTGITNVTFPTSGTLATTSQLVTPAALTKTDDTNVTLTLGGAPSTALVNAASITVGWTGQLAVSRGGTGISSFGTGVATALGQNVTGSGGIVLANTPTLVTPTLGAANATSLNFGASATNGIIGVTGGTSAAAGVVGEIITSSVNSVSTSLTTNTDANVTFIDVTAGQWDIFGQTCFNGNAGTGVIINLGWMSITSAALPSSNVYSSLFFSTGGAVLPYSVASVSMVVPMMVLNVNTTTRVYLSVRSSFITSTSTAGGTITAVRRR